jgi:hypothetical protein
LGDGFYRNYDHFIDKQANEVKARENFVLNEKQKRQDWMKNDRVSTLKNQMQEK